MLKSEIGSDTVYYTRGFELISRREGTAASYYIYDGGLSVRVLTNEAGTVTDTLVFDAFGNETGRSGTTDNPYGFQGEEQDATGLYYLRARYMDPATGTFTTMDTYGGSLSDPMSLHKYLFANSNPVMYCDPSGHSTSLGEAACVIGIIGALAGMDLYVLNIVSTGGEITPEGIALSAIIGSIVAVAIFFAIYALAYTICNAILAWGVFNSASGVLAEGVIIKMIESGLVNALEYELIWTIAGLRDIKSGTDYSDKFSGSGIIKNFVIGLILGIVNTTKAYTFSSIQD